MAHLDLMALDLIACAGVKREGVARISVDLPAATGQIDSGHRQLMGSFFADPLWLVCCIIHAAHRSTLLRSMPPAKRRNLLVM